MSQDGVVVAAAGFPAKGRARSALEQDSLLAPAGGPFQPTGVVPGDCRREAAGAGAQQVAALLDDRGLDVGEGTHVGDRDAGFR